MSINNGHYVDLPEAAARLNLSYAHVRKLVATGMIASRKVPRIPGTRAMMILIPASEVDYFAENRRGPGRPVSVKSAQPITQVRIYGPAKEADPRSTNGQRAR